MERLSAEGHFFHRDCFRCDVCNCTLRLGTHTYDSHEGKFYCKMHYAQSQSSTHAGRFRRKMEDQSCLDSTQTCTTAGSDTVAGTMVSFLRRGLHWPRRACRAVCVLPKRLLGNVCECFTAVGSHFRSHSHDYVFFYELLSVGIPLLCMMHELSGQIYQEQLQQLM